jgi:hypothetical protein
LSGRLRRVAALAFVLLSLSAARQAAAAPFDDGILPLDQYPKEAGRALARAHAAALRDLSAGIYHCVPWVDVLKHSIGFFKPRHLTHDDRYLSMRIYVEQEPSPQFSTLPLEGRASAMFSRYVGAMLRRMARDPAIMADQGVVGFTVVLEWLKQGPRAAGARPVHETIAVFVEKPTAAQYLAGTLSMRDLAGQARVFGWDGATSVGVLRVSGWDDDFVATHKVKDYKPDPGASCP